MKKKKVDFLSRPFPVLALMFANVFVKIDDYKTSYELSDPWIARIKLICQTFTIAYEKVMQNRATGKQQNDWFKDLWKGKLQGNPAPAAPVFQTITLPAGAFINLKEEFRLMIKFFKANSAYTEADGVNLMILDNDTEERNIAETIPKLKNTVNVNGEVETRYVKYEFGGLELQWRLEDTEVWQLADKSTENLIIFKPVSGTPGVLFKIELRGIYLLKNQRVGLWSPIYTLNIG